MQLHELKRIHKAKKRKRIGRGGKRGTFSGRGQKGQKSRAGHRLKPLIRDLIKRYPKLRGYRMESQVPASKIRIVVNLDVLESRFVAGEKVNPESLLEKKIISKIKGRMPAVKILGRGQIGKEIIVEGCQISKSAKEKIEKAHGMVK